MGVDKIVKLVGVLFAIVAAFVAIPESAAIVALLGIAGGWFISQEEMDNRRGFLIAALALNMAHAGLNDIWAVGGYITTALGGVNGLFLAAAATVIVLGIVERLKP